MEHWVQMVMMGRPGGALATPRRDGVLSKFRRPDAVNRKSTGRKAENSNVKFSRQPMTPNRLKKP